MIHEQCHGHRFVQVPVEVGVGDCQRDASRGSTTATIVFLLTSSLHENEYTMRYAMIECSEKSIIE